MDSLVQATDPDCGVNAMVNYTLAAGRMESEQLMVRSDTGDICVRTPLDRETAPYLEIPVIATDRVAFRNESSVTRIGVRKEEPREQCVSPWPYRGHVEERRNAETRAKEETGTKKKGRPAWRHAVETWHQEEKKQPREPCALVERGKSEPIAVPRSSSSVMGCMIYVAGVWCAHFQQPPSSLLLRERTMTEVADSWTICEQRRLSERAAEAEDKEAMDAEEDDRPKSS
ncbi:hypothetical protein K0M31_004906 [Melipona bicolor]|uniref:Cadherin domain-containing protein n=1 Tax=Melipona bicolor TaxID=60889 RepID=A0AA40FWA2_9HYME|nr:hypothetical protein K0M31_004906 [Melipona bicolor]